MAERLGDRLERLDQSIRNWSKVTRKDLAGQLLSMGLHARARLATQSAEGPGLVKSIRSTLKKRDGEIEKVAFQFARHGIFLEHGVGKGRPVRSAKALAYRRPWLSKILPDAVEDLAELLSEEYADIFAAELRFLIPGIIDTKISK